MCTRNRKILNALFFYFGHLSIQSVASSISFGVIEHTYITRGLLVHGY